MPPDDITTHTVEQTEGEALLDLDQFGPTDKNLDLTIEHDGPIAVSGGYRYDAEFLRVRAADGADPTFVIPPDTNDWLFWFKGASASAKCIIEGVDIDVSEETAVAGIRVHSPQFHVRDVEFVGRGTHPDPSVKPCFDAACTAEGGLGVIEDVVASEGSTWARYKGGDGRMFAWVGDSHVGNLRVRDCRVEEFGNNGIYGSEAVGPIIVENCEFWNNNVSSVRFGSKGSKITHSTIGIDTDRYSGPREPNHEETAWYMRTTWHEAKRPPAAAAAGPSTIENSKIVISEGDTKVDTGLVGLECKRNGPGLRVTNTTIDVDRPGAPGIFAAAPGETDHYPEPAGPFDIRLSNTTIVSRSGKAVAVHSTGRDVTVGEGCCIEARGTDATGVQVRDGALTFEGESTLVADRPCVPEDTDLSMVATDGGCTLGTSDPTTPSPGVGIDLPDIDPPGKDSPIADPAPIPAPDAPGSDETPETPTYPDHLPAMDIHVRNDGDGPFNYELELASSAQASVLDNPQGDEVADGHIRGRVWPDNADGYELRGWIVSHDFSGEDTSGVTIVIDGDEFGPDEFKSELIRRAGSDVFGAAEKLLEDAVGN